MLNFADFLIKKNKSKKKIVFKGKKLTYSELYDKVKELSQNLFFKNKNELIGLRLDNSEEFLILYLSIIKSGNIAVIIDKGLSEVTFKSLLIKFKIDKFIGDIDYDVYDTLNPNDCKNISQKLNSKKPIFYHIKKVKKISFTTHLKDVAIILFTSGSTGLKKGVMLTHKNLISNTKSILKILPIKSSDVTNMLLPVSYSFGLSILNTHLKKAASIFIHTSPFIGSIISEIKKYKCTSFYGVPSTFQILLEKTDFIKKNFATLRYIGQAGGKLDPKYIKILLTRYTNKLHVMYGATEASPRLSHIPPKYLNQNMESIGIPIPGVKFKLFKIKNSSKFQLGVSGPNIMKGYLNEKKNTKNILTNKFFLTGDIAFKDKNNFYFIEKRMDKIIKRFGYKINLNVIENTIKSIPYIKKSSLIIDANNQMICFALVPKSKLKVAETHINNLLAKKFTTYEIPDKINLSYKENKFFNKKVSLEEIYKK